MLPPRGLRGLRGVEGSLAPGAGWADVREQGRHVRRALGNEGVAGGLSTDPQPPWGEDNGLACTALPSGL